MNCPCCEAAGHYPFYEVRNIPTHSVLLMPTRESAVGYPCRDLVLNHCRSCGFIFNSVFDESAPDYSQRYEETQGFSPTFNAFHRRLAQQLVERHGLHNKRVLEIGCGKGEFLSLLCEAGDNDGIGFDPAFVPARGPANSRIEFVPTFFEGANHSVQADFICCKMTLEHVPRPLGLLQAIRRSIGQRSHTTVFFMVPDAIRILEESAFWDVYYEHCCYFTAGSLARLFEGCGFEVLSVERVYGDQYITVEARIGDGSNSQKANGNDIPVAEQTVRHFAESAGSQIRMWRETLHNCVSAGQTVVLWGSGSKAVSFLTTLGVDDEVACTVDINPYRQGTWMPGSGHAIVAPERLLDVRPDLVIVMNSVYRGEVEARLSALHLAPKLIALGDLAPHGGEERSGPLEGSAC